MDQDRRKRLARLVFSLPGVLLVLLSVSQIGAAARGIEITAVRSPLPLTIVAPAGVAPGSRPLVLVGHGFAASGLVMRGFAYTLAHAGYVVALWDFDGHGANPRPWRSQPLIANAETALAAAQARGMVTPGRVAILGHSMGSGVALEFGQTYPDTAATIAVSPVGQPVTPELPRNLLLLAGSLERPFVRNAERRLAEAGGSGGDPALGTALLLPWFLSAGRLSSGNVPSGQAVAAQLGRWLAQSAALLGGLYLAVRLSSELGFLSLILPAFPAILGLHALAAGPYRKPWAFALSGALFTSWALLAMFPLQ